MVTPLLTTQRVRKPATATFVIIAINFVVFAVELFSSDAFIESWTFVPADLTAFLSGSGSPIVLLTLLTSTFMHASLGHIAGNMLFLWVFGQAIEQAFGSRLYLRFYLLAALAASLTQYVVDPTSTIPNLGASGAIAGVMGAFLAVFPNERVAVFVWPLSLIIRRDLFIPAWVMLGGWFLTQVLSAWGAAYGADDGGVAFFAHIGGFLFGFLVAPLAMRSLRVREASR